MSEISSGRKRWCFRGSGGGDDGGDELPPPPHENVPADAAAAPGGRGRVPELPSSKRSVGQARGVARQGRAELFGQYVCILEMPWQFLLSMRPKMPSPRLECTRA